MRIVVVGLGSMGKRRIRLLRKIDSTIEIIGIDNNEDRRISVIQEYEITGVEDFQEVKGDVDCAFICTSPQSHASIITECLERKWHVFTEINLVSDGYEKNVNLAKENGKVLFLSSTPLYKEEMRYIDKVVKRNAEQFAYSYHVGQYLPDWHPWDNLKDFFIGKKETNGCREIFAIELPWLQYTFGKIIAVQVVKRKII